MSRRWVALGAGVLGYLGLPYLLVQWANLGLLREGKRARLEIALTFDDGPQPATTPAVLDALRDAGMHATFFVLAAHAQAHPALIRRMLDEGHEVQAHAVKHVHAWWRSPWGAFRDPGEAARRIGAVTGQPVTLHRPPHGAYTLATILGQRVAGLTGAHWSLEGGDWRRNAMPDGVRTALLERLVPGAVVVLHDAGPGARVTVPMLPALLGALRARGYTSVPLSRLEGATPVNAAALNRRAFIALDRLFDRLGGIRPAGGLADNIFRVGLAAFPMQEVTLHDGLTATRGMPGVEFHVNNPVLVDLGPRASVRRGRQDFRALARDLQTVPEYRDAQVVYCLSALAPLLALVGFETHDLPEGQTRRLQSWANMLRRAYGNPPEAKAPKLSVLSRDAFLRLYGER
ncbi:polysaccharide deacetylase family protein [Deinococcus sp. KSM4-11]|uniref:polysaccharide deacetylase family protein n=1 Tax=Deinococcus sp. KSM4-11 TaxID=2568654 RepID=UPI0010A49F1B|nr:polysaccharide deacetylase family protein [Deinococcus sp. KSM4-11]THF88873.1 polysaccharide deacetylase family protein [Deinococcus sp. KSM4-11]